MIIDENSILKSLPSQNFNQKEFYYIETIVTFIGFVESNYKKLSELLSKGDINVNDHYEIILAIWGIIDNYRRLECLLNQFPGINKEDPLISIYLNKIKKAKDFRHIIQHYNREIESTFIPKILPALGHVSFANQDEKELSVRLIVPGYLRKYKRLEIVNPVGQKIRTKIDLITYFLGEHQIDLSDLFYETRDFIKILEKIIIEKK